MMLSRLTFLKSDFFKNISYQMVGTGLAQLFPFAAMPILTRLFTEQDFAVYTSFFAIASILAVGVGGRYQFAIVLPRENKDALSVFTLSVYITIGYSLAVFILMWLIAPDMVGANPIYVSGYVLCFGLWNSLLYLSVRNKSFLENAKAKVLQSIAYIGGSAALGFAKLTLFGLVIGKIVGVVVSGIYLFKVAALKPKLIGLQGLREVAVTYKDYPTYGLVPAFLDIASVQGLVLILTRFYETEELGHFGLTALVLSAPLGLVAGSFRDVFYQRMASLITEGHHDDAIRVFKRSALGLFLVGLPICVVIYFFGPVIFSFVFGDQWRASGTYASLIAASFLVQLVVSPLSSVFNAANRLKVASLWQILYFITTFSTLGISSLVLKLGINDLLVVYAVHEVVLYALYFSLQYWTLKNLKEYVRN